MSKVTPVHRSNNFTLASSKFIAVILSLVLIIQSVVVIDYKKVNAEYTEDTQPPTAPVNFTVTPVSGSAITFKTTEHTKDIVASVSGSAIVFVWDASTDNVGVEGYEIFCENNPVGKTTVTNYTYSDVNGPSSKQFYVFAYDRAGNISDQSNKVNVIFDPEAIIKDKQEPTIPANVIAVPNPEGSVTLSWDASVDNVGIEGYKIYKNGVIIGFTKDTSFTDTEYDPEANDIYCIAAYDLAGNRSQESEPALLVLKEPAEDELSYRTDRYIIKYRNEFGNKNFKQLMNDRIKSNRKLKSKNNEDIEVIVLDKKVKPEEFIESIQGKKNNKLSAFDYASDIVYIQPDYQFTALSSDPYFDQQWGIRSDIESEAYNIADDIPDNNISEISEEYQIPNNKNTHLSEVWNRTKGTGTIVAVLDTGIDITHEDLANNIWINRKEIPGNNIDDDGNGYVDDIAGWDFVNNNNSVHNEANINDEWHGTHIAGIIAAEEDNHIGITGVSPDAVIMPLKIFENGIAYTSDIISAIEYAEMMGVKIVNCSWGSSDYNQALEEAIANSNMLFVCAAGNNHVNADYSPTYPASFGNENIISVASINKKGILSGFTNYGEYSVDIAAPGEDIISSYPGNAYVTSGGTSMAAAYVSGVAALILSTNKDISLIKDRILNTSDKLSSLIGKIVNGNYINYYNAVHNVTDTQITQVTAIDNNKYNNIIPSGDSDYTLYSGGTWTSKPNYGRYYSGCKTIAANGLIYLIGGWIDQSQGYSNYLYEYNPSSNYWTNNGNYKTFLPVRASNSALAAVNGKIYVFGGSNSDGAINSAYVYDPATNLSTWLPGMPTARSGACTAVYNGIIYVIGGNRSGDLNTVEAFNPATNTWTTKASMITARYGAGAYTYYGKIYVAGGSWATSIEVYDPVTNSWTVKSSMPSARSSAGINSINGKLYVLGGIVNGYPASSVDEYSPVTDSWSTSPDMPTARSGLPTAAVNNILYAFGGSNGNTIEVFTPAPINDDYLNDYGNNISTAKPVQENTEILGVINYGGDEDYFSFTSAISQSYDIFTTGNMDSYGYIYNNSGTLLASNDNDSGLNFKISIHMLSGQTYYIKVKHSNPANTGIYSLWITKALQTPVNISYTVDSDAITFSWSTVTGATSYEVEINGTIYPAGSNLFYKHIGPLTGMAHIYRFRAKNNNTISAWSKYYFASAYGGTWQIRDNLPAARANLSSICLNGSIYSVGGYNGSYSNMVEAYNITTKAWSVKANMLTPRADFGLISLNGKMYAIGGYNGTYLTSVEEYNPVTNTWTAKASMPTARSDFGIAELNGKIYVMGGYSASAYLNVVEEYDPNTNTWATKASMPTARYDLSSVSSGNKIYAIGGKNNSVLSTVEEYNPVTNTWASKASMIAARYRHGSTIINDKIYTAGGTDANNSYLNTVEVYSISNNTWSSYESKLIKSASFGIASNAGVIYIIGGKNSQYDCLPSIENMVIDQLDYIYDLNNRLIEIRRKGRTIAVFSYDKNGNLLSIQTIP